MFVIAVMPAFIGGRPGMISAATILTGVLQLVFRLLRLSRYMKFVPRAVMTGFVNALAILIFLAQLPRFVGASRLHLPMKDRKKEKASNSTDRATNGSHVHAWECLAPIGDRRQKWQIQSEPQ
ncbi:SulP family inorganic anion transporter [Corallococcus exiguus]|uniref:SulP family inorganic anion transporter n=1 Tax=Corallococcus exiguus TaxID=83462 RepID=UPI0024B57F52